MIVVRDLIESVVQKVSDNIKAYLIEKDDKITAVHFMAGHPLEINNRLLKRSETGNHFNKYPLIALFQDFEERKGEAINEYAKVKLNLIIARATNADFIADQRYSENFRSILYPIYEEFLSQLNESRAGKWKHFKTYGVDSIKHTKIDRLFWGKRETMQNSSNNFGDYIDCIEIRDLELSINIKNC